MRDLTQLDWSRGVRQDPLNTSEGLRHSARIALGRARDWADTAERLLAKAEDLEVKQIPNLKDDREEWVSQMGRVIALEGWGVSYTEGAGDGFLARCRCAARGVLKAAQWDGNPKGGDAQQAPSRSDDSPVGEADAPSPSPLVGEQ